jgi:DNA-binding beta-propeller fold protein YncE
VRTVIYTFSEGNGPSDVAIDSSGNYIITEYRTKILSKITPSSERTVIYTFPEAGSHPNVVVIDSSGNYIVTDSGANTLSKVTPSGMRTLIYTFSAGTEPMGVAIDSSGNYIVNEVNVNILSKVTPDGVRTVIYTFPSGTTPDYVLISTAPQLFFADVTDSGLMATWTQNADPSFAGYQLYQSTAQGQLGTLIGTNTNVVDTSMTVTGLSPWTTYYFTLRVLGANGAYVDYGQRIVTTAKAFWQEMWFTQVMFVVVIVAVLAIAIYVVRSRSKKRAKVT